MKNAKIIPEECVPKHKLLVVDLIMKGIVKRKSKYTLRLRVWKLKDQTCRKQFAAKVREGAAVGMKDLSVNGKRNAMKTVLNEAAEKVVGWTKGKPKHKET